ncbi:ABC transporter permease [Murimonas intestini]|uniref:Monosaccharide ABC transporter membrane protein (CUT2 family) n=1 Tax=Murimonas intestini TaxID=1337051 RepID=A0AB73T1A1_9FIRM|nr:ABC transporter permease [Murimonas intestini]MCR1840354.1 ABC transporter permease [Murimonas intestini]MCR1867535.1 ABC transporter permease [Murimonas intestini]MCR1884722.1 ABC transporter permease [Murimonas intestini]
MNAIYKKYRREWSALIALFITIILFSVLEHSYLSATNIATIVTQSVTYGLMGIGMTCVIITGGIDLSVGSSLALLACVGAQLAKAGMPIPIWIVVCLALGFLMGVINGVLVGVMKLQPFIATMGTMQIYRGIGYVITGGFPVLNVPRNYRNVFNFKITSVITFSVIVFFLFAIIITFVLKKMKIGTYAYAVGGNEDAARLSGVRVERTKALLYGIGMLGTTLAALIMIGRLGTGDPSTGQGYEMDAIAAAAIGGTSMAGGRGNIFGTVIGAVLFSALKVGLVVMGVDTFYQYIVTGIVIVIAAYIEIVQGNMLSKKKEK